VAVQFVQLPRLARRRVEASHRFSGAGLPTPGGRAGQRVQKRPQARSLPNGPCPVSPLTTNGSGGDGSSRPPARARVQIRGGRPPAWETRGFPAHRCRAAAAVYALPRAMVTSGLGPPR